MNWSNDKIDTLKANYLSKSSTEIAALIGCTPHAVKSKARVLGLIKRHPLTAEQIITIRQMYADASSACIAELIGAKLSAVYQAAARLGLKKSKEYNSSQSSGRIQRADHRGRLTQFKKGQVSFNAGKRQKEYMSKDAIQRTVATRFKKGVLPHNTKERDGVITIRKSKGRPYKYIRVGLGKWELLHRVIWIEKHGKIRKGYNVQFRDNNPLNCQLSNLYLIKRQDQMMQNTIHRYPAEIKQAIRTLSKLKRNIKKYEEQD